MPQQLPLHKKRRKIQGKSQQLNTSMSMQLQQQNDTMNENNAALNLHDCYRKKISLLLHSISDVVSSCPSNTNSTANNSSENGDDEIKKSMSKLDDPMEWARSISLRYLYGEKSDDISDSITDTIMNDSITPPISSSNFFTKNDAENIENATMKTQNETAAANEEKNAIVEAIRSLANDPSLDTSSSLFQQEDFACATCGTLLLPGSKNGTTIRLRTRKRGRSRRRKCSRTKAADHISKVKSQKVRSGSGKEWSSPIPSNTKSNSSQLSTTTTLENLTQQQRYTQIYKSLHQTKDGTTFNSIVYNCNYCGNKMELKGLPVSAKDKKNITSNKRMQKQSMNATKVDKVMERKRKGVNMPRETSYKKKRYENGANAQEEEDGFISLGAKLDKNTRTVVTDALSPPPTTPVSTMKKAQPSANMPSITHLSQSTGKKKKKKRKSAGGAENKDSSNKSKSDLMNFLSSLND